MKKTLIAIGLLSAFGGAHAASSVQLYGTINVAVTKKGDAGVTLKAQEYRYASHVGLKGSEDLGNGYSAIFKLEAELEPDTGSGTYGSDGKAFSFNRQAYVGLVTPFGAFRFGRSYTPFVNMWIGGNFSEGRGIGEFTGGLAGSGLRTTHPEVAARWNNALFYDIKKGGFSAGLAVTTKGSQSVVPTRTEHLRASQDLKTAGGAVVVPKGTIISPATTSVDNEGKKGTKPAYGLYARYEGQSGLWGYKVGAAYQVENGGSYQSSSNNQNAPAEAQKAWLVGAGVSYGPVAFNAGYAVAKINNTDLTVASGARLRTAKSKTLFASLAYNVTSHDKIYVSYGRLKRSNDYIFAAHPVTGATLLSGSGDIKGSQYSMGYEHNLSKRTTVYANVRKVTNITNSCTAKTATGISLTNNATATYVSSCGVAIETVDSVLKTEKGWSYDIGITHSF